MQLRPLGLSEIRISPIIMGTWQAGKTMWTDIDDKQSQRAIRAAFDAGITAYDTAEVYGNGHSERILGKSLEGIRHEVVVATKVFSNHLKPKQIISACERSLRNLKTDYIDLYQIHWPPGSFGHPAVPMQEVFDSLKKLLIQGKIRTIGVSNFDLAQMEEAAQFGEIVSLQPPYSLFWRHVEKDAAPYCRKNKISILAYAPMAQGLLTGKYNADHQFKKGDHRRTNRLYQPEHYDRINKALAELKSIAESNGATLGQLALAWVIAQPQTYAIAGARSAEQAKQNAAAGQIQLSSGDLAAMDDISRSVTDHLDDNPVLWNW
jgi:aryl-alcohol dehydrogenase-like predicted oxidoreductase